MGVGQWRDSVALTSRKRENARLPLKEGRQGGGCEVGGEAGVHWWESARSSWFSEERKCGSNTK